MKNIETTHGGNDDFASTNFRCLTKCIDRLLLVLQQIGGHVSTSYGALWPVQLAGYKPAFDTLPFSYHQVDGTFSTPSVHIRNVAGIEPELLGSLTDLSKGTRVS